MNTRMNCTTQGNATTREEERGHNGTVTQSLTDRSVMIAWLSVFASIAAGTSILRLDRAAGAVVAGCAVERLQINDHVICSSRTPLSFPRIVNQSLARHLCSFRPIMPVRRSR